MEAGSSRNGILLNQKTFSTFSSILVRFLFPDRLGDGEAETKKVARFFDQPTDFHAATFYKISQKDGRKEGAGGAKEKKRTPISKNPKNTNMK